MLLPKPTDTPCNFGGLLRDEPTMLVERSKSSLSYQLLVSLSPYYYSPGRITHTPSQRSGLRRGLQWPVIYNANERRHCCCPTITWQIWPHWPLMQLTMPTIPVSITEHAGKSPSLLFFCTISQIWAVAVTTNLQMLRKELVTPVLVHSAVPSYGWLLPLNTVAEFCINFSVIILCRHSLRNIHLMPIRSPPSNQQIWKKLCAKSSNDNTRLLQTKHQTDDHAFARLTCKTPKPQCTAGTSSCTGTPDSMF